MGEEGILNGPKILVSFMEGPISKLAEFKKKNHCYNKYDFQCWSFENMGQIGVDLGSSQIFF